MKILIVDDSPTETEILKKMFQSQPDFKIVGCAKNGKEAVELTHLLKPDVITMDVRMPVMDGLEATRIIMSHCPTPIVIITSYANHKDLKISFTALEAGALSVIEKPSQLHEKNFNVSQKRIVDIVRSMAEIKVIKKRSFGARSKKTTNLRSMESPFDILAIGTSVGGPQTLKAILSKLSSDFPVPIVIVQHMTDGFMQGFTKWLDSNISLQVKSAEQNEELKSGVVYFAPDHFHLEIKRQKEKLICHLASGQPVSGFCPSATVLFNSVAKACGNKALGLLLTGMGSDGAQGLLEIKKNHGHTVIQDAESAIVFGMGNVALSLGAVDKVVELEHMADYLTTVMAKKI